MSSIIEQAEVDRLRKRYNEHEQARRFHQQEATLAHFALIAAKLRLQKARVAEGLAANAGQST